LVEEAGDEEEGADAEERQGSGHRAERREVIEEDLRDRDGERDEPRDPDRTGSPDEPDVEER
jgi:hypothetical protein